MIQAGKVSDINWSNGTWLILDIGFSNTKKSCGLLLGDSEAEQLQFGEVINKVAKFSKSESLLNLVIEAPLSVAFDKCGNPKSRSIDKQDKKSRPWYVGPGCAVMVATMYLLRGLFDCHLTAEIKLFEGFVSFKSGKIRSSHTDDVKCLRDAIKQKDTQISRLFGPDELKEDSSDRIISAFKIMNLKNIDLGVPAVIMIDKRGKY